MTRKISEERAIEEILKYVTSHGWTEAEELAVVLDLPLHQVREALVEIDLDELGDVDEDDAD